MTNDQRGPAGPGQEGTGAPPQQQRGVDTGGIPHTLDSTIHESRQAPDRVPAISPAEGANSASVNRSQEASEGLEGVRGGPTAVPEQLGASPDKDPPGREDESAAESLGRAIGAALSGEANKKEPRR